MTPLQFAFAIGIPVVIALLIPGLYLYYDTITKISVFLKFLLRIYLFCVIIFLGIFGPWPLTRLGFFTILLYALILLYYFLMGRIRDFEEMFTSERRAHALRDTENRELLVAMAKRMNFMELDLDRILDEM